ncbi:MAG: CBS domain-containing protein [Nitrosopumilaceae archaeon]
MALNLLNESITKFTTHKMTAVASNLTISDTARVMVDSNVDSVLVFEHGQIIGIVTEKDIFQDIVAKDLDPKKITVKKIAKKPLITIRKDATVREAIDLMEKHNIRRLVVMDKRPIGLITQKMVCGNLGEDSFTLPELVSEKILCPYCSSQFENKKILSKHIDDIHIGRGLLEGNLKRTTTE